MEQQEHSAEAKSLVETLYAYHRQERPLTSEVGRVSDLLSAYKKEGLIRSDQKAGATEEQKPAYVLRNPIDVGPIFPFLIPSSTNP